MANTIQLYGAAFGNWIAAIGLAIGYEWRKRSSRGRFGIGALTSFAEPFLILVFLLIFRIWLRDTLPRFGLSAAVFYASGLLPYFLFQRLSARGRATKYEIGGQLPRITTTDQVIATLLLEICMYMTAFMLWFYGMWLYGLEEAKPWSVVDCLIPLCLLACLGIGAGLTSSAIAYFFPPWSYIWARVNRLLMFASGVLFIVDLMEYRIREFVVWNPLAHAIEWFRLGLYGSYPHSTLDKEYLIYWALGTLLTGIVCHAATLRRTAWAK